MKLLQKKGSSCAAMCAATVSLKKQIPSSQIDFTRLASVLLLVMASCAEGAIIQPLSIVSNDFGDIGGTFVDENMFDGQGMSGPLSGSSTYTYTVSDDSYWHATNAGFPGTVRFDLGTDVSLTTFYLWQNTHDSSTHFVNDFQLAFFLSDASTQVGATVSFTGTGATAASPATSETFGFAQRDNVRFVDLNILSTSSFGGRPVIGELAFESASVALPVK